MKRSPLKTRSTPPSRYLRILVVEGDATMREGLDVYFALLGHRAHLAAALSQAAGFQGHLVKPFTPQHLEKALAQAASAVRGQQPSG